MCAPFVEGSDCLSDKGKLAETLSEAAAGLPPNLAPDCTWHIHDCQWVPPPSQRRPPRSSTRTR